MNITLNYTLAQAIVYKFFTRSFCDLSVFKVDNVYH